MIRLACLHCNGVTPKSIENIGGAGEVEDQLCWARVSRTFHLHRDTHTHSIHHLLHKWKHYDCYAIDTLALLCTQLRQNNTKNAEQSMPESYHYQDPGSFSRRRKRKYDDVK